MTKRLTRAGMTLELRQLRARLRETEETLRAIRAGQVDALVVSGPDGDRVFTLAGAEHPYRVLVEALQEGALMLLPDGAIVYSNACFARMVHTPLERVIGASLDAFVAPERHVPLRAALSEGLQRSSKMEATMLAGIWGAFAAELSFSPLPIDNTTGIAVVVNDISGRKTMEQELRRQSPHLVAIAAGIR